jgi:hypothetical protein
MPASTGMDHVASTGTDLLPIPVWAYPVGAHTADVRINPTLDVLRTRWLSTPLAAKN